MILNFDENPPALNGKKGMLRTNWHKRGDTQARWNGLVAGELGRERKTYHRCRLIYTRRGLRLMDWDNFCASFKMLGDALVHMGVLADDNPDVVVDFVPKQVRVHTRAEVGCSVEIIEVDDGEVA